MARSMAMRAQMRYSMAKASTPTKASKKAVSGTKKGQSFGGMLTKSCGK